jgi:hypothetical protein
MSVTLLALALVGVGGWFVLFASHERPGSLFRLLVASLALQTVVATLVAVALVSFGAFRPVLALGLTAGLSLGSLLGADRGRLRLVLKAPLISRDEGLVLLVLGLSAPLVLPRMEMLRMDNDAGVYSNRAIHHLLTGGMLGSVPARDRLEGDLLAAFDRDNMLRAPEARAGSDGGTWSYLPGTYVLPSNHRRFVFQFFPGWPMAMALWAGIFGLPAMFHALSFLYALDVVLFGLLLERYGGGPLGRFVGLALFASSPLLLFFSKYTTSEVFLLFAFLFALHLLASDSHLHGVLAAAPLLLFVVSHASTFLYAPLVLLVLLEAVRSGSRRLASFSALAFLVLLGGLALGHIFSPFYLRDIFFLCFLFLPLADPAAVGLAAVATFYSAGLALSLAVLARASGPPERLRMWGERAEITLSRLVAPALVLVALWTAFRGYQLGWTDRFIEGAGAWTSRVHYAGRGWESLAHLDVVSMVLATSVIGLPLVAAGALRQGRELTASRKQGFLVAAALWTLALYTFFRVDTPFNYYASRYFLPILVPSVLLILPWSIETLGGGRRTLILLGSLALAFNLFSDRAFYHPPRDDDKLRFVLDVAGKVRRGGTLFVRADLRTFRLLALGVQSLRGAEVVRVAHLRGMPERVRIAEYAARLGLAGATVLSSVRPTDVPDVEVVDVADRELAQRGIIYPTEYFDRRSRYYLYDVAFPATGRAGGGRESAPRDRDQVE